ncbi:hypothetical protein T281_11995 [Rhodomicrobium udaipurense JA643]|nr:hypothetical protein T281_11995 [Rhodomicrobium udaipurense JA643]
MQGSLVTEAARGTFVVGDLLIEAGAWRSRSPSPVVGSAKASPAMAEREILRFSDFLLQAAMAIRGELCT